MNVLMEISSSSTVHQYEYVKTENGGICVGDYGETHKLQLYANRKECLQMVSSIPVNIL